MNCMQMEALLPAHADGEAPAVLDGSITRHLAACPRCRATHDAVVALGTRIRRETPYHAAPAALRARMESQWGGRAKVARPRVSSDRWQWIGGGALGGAMATLLAWSLGTTMITARVEQGIAVAAVDRHVAASLAGRVIEVASSDRHTVKPWLSAHLDYSPPVRDFAGDGFPLVGGRVDRMDGRDVAVLVYGYGSHVVDVFVWPTLASSVPVSPAVVRGFNVVPARSATMSWLAVSDAEPAAVDALVDRLCHEDAGHEGRE